jgi:hypothetical protein
LKDPCSKRKSNVRTLANGIRLILINSALVANTTYSQDDYPVDYNDPPSTSSAPVADSGDGKKSEDDDNVIKRIRETSEPIVKDFSKKDVSKACLKYNGKLVSISGEIWIVKDCKRHQIHDPDHVFKLNRQGKSVVEADSRDMAAIPIGKSWETLQHEKQRPCSFFNGKYVTYSYTDIYFVERCYKRLIPDYETLLTHRKKMKIPSSEILALTDAEFYSMKPGRDITSIIDQEFAKLLDGSAGVDIIPIDEACKGIEGKNVSFYSKIYKIEKCRKREYDAELFTLKFKGRDRELKLVELKPEQWVSIPDGKPIK